jgi:hypothetical protein
MGLKENHDFLLIKAKPLSACHTEKKRLKEKKGAVITAVVSDANSNNRKKVWYSLHILVFVISFLWSNCICAIDFDK